MSQLKLAVVGCVNMGKSSIVASLVEDDGVLIESRAGSTLVNAHYQMNLSENASFTLIDTPGFQNARRALAWIENYKKEHENQQCTPTQAVEAFLSENAENPSFQHEVELLRPILREGAGVLYVVNGQQPYLARYEAEMRILAMTGAPRMGVVNLIQGQSPYLEAWEAAIRPWLKAVQFDAHRCGLADRLSLLESFKGVDDRWAAVIHSALNSIQEDWANRAERSAEAIAQMIKDMLCAFEEAPLSDQRLKQEDELRERLMSKLPECEEMCRSRVEQLYHHGELVREEESVQALKFDLLDREGWQLLGLNKTQLASAGSVAGALTGGALDLSVGGASFFAGTVIGAMLGGVGAVWGGDSLGNVKVLGQPLGGKVLRVEVGASLEFAFVILDRALIHWAHVAKRAHARRDKLDLKANEMSVVSGLEKKQRNRFAKSFRHLWKQPDQSNWAPSFKALVLEIGPKEGLSKIQA